MPIQISEEAGKFVCKHRIKELFHDQGHFLNSSYSHTPRNQRWIRRRLKEKAKKDRSFLAQISKLNQETS